MRHWFALLLAGCIKTPAAVETPADPIALGRYVGTIERAEVSVHVEVESTVDVDDQGLSAIEAARVAGVRGRLERAVRPDDVVVWMQGSAASALGAGPPFAYSPSGGEGVVVVRVDGYGLRGAPGALRPFIQASVSVQTLTGEELFSRRIYCSGSQLESDDPETQRVALQRAACACGAQAIDAVKADALADATRAPVPGS